MACGSYATRAATAFGAARPRVVANVFAHARRDGAEPPACVGRGGGGEARARASPEATARRGGRTDLVQQLVERVLARRARLAEDHLARRLR